MIVFLKEKDITHKVWKRSDSLTDYQICSDLRTSLKTFKRKTFRLQTGSKRANVIPVYKKGDKRNVCNYIPIFNLPLLIMLF